MAHEIINRGRGPELAGTRFTVYDVIPMWKKGRIPAYIASVLGLSEAQVRTLIKYIEDHREEVMAENAKIEERIARGNPPEIAAKIEAARGTARRMREELLKKREQESNGASNPQ